MDVSALTSGGVPLAAVERLAGEQSSEPTAGGVAALKEAMELQQRMAAEMLRQMGIGTAVDVKA